MSNPCIQHMEKIALNKVTRQAIAESWPLAKIRALEGQGFRSPEQHALGQLYGVRQYASKLVAGPKAQFDPGYWKGLSSEHTPVDSYQRGANSHGWEAGPEEFRTIWQGRPGSVSADDENTKAFLKAKKSGQIRKTVSRLMPAFSRALGAGERAYPRTRPVLDIHPISLASADSAESLRGPALSPKGNLYTHVASYIPHDESLSGLSGEVSDLGRYLRAGHSAHISHHELHEAESAVRRLPTARQTLGKSTALTYHEGVFENANMAGGNHIGPEILIRERKRLGQDPYAHILPPSTEHHVGAQLLHAGVGKHRDITREYAMMDSWQKSRSVRSLKKLPLPQVESESVQHLPVRSGRGSEVFDSNLASMQGAKQGTPAYREAWQAPPSRKSNFADVDKKWSEKRSFVMQVAQKALDSQRDSDGKIDWGKMLQKAQARRAPPTRLMKEEGL